MPLGNDTSVLDALVMGSGAVVMSVVNTETPSAILPQGAIPYGMVGLVVATFEAIRERGVLSLVSLVFRDGTCFKAVFSFDVAPFIFGWSLSSEDTG